MAFPVKKERRKPFSINTTSETFFIRSSLPQKKMLELMKTSKTDRCAVFVGLPTDKLNNPNSVSLLH
jgi:hypothetical protein